MAPTREQTELAVDAVLPLSARRAAFPSQEARARAARSPLLELEDDYRALVQQSSVCLFLIDADGTIVRANDATGRLLGRDADDVVGLTVADITHPDDVAESRERMSRAIRDGVELYRIEKRYIRGDGSLVDADITVSLLRGPDGLPVGFLATAVDDTARKEAQRSARAAAALLRATVDSFVDPWVLLVAVRDEHGTIVDFTYADINPAACRHNGLDREQVLGRRLLELQPGHVGGLLERYAAVVDTGVPLAEDDVLYVTDGEDRWFSNRAVAVGDDALSLTWRDTTEQVRLRRELATRAVTDPLTGLLNRDGLDEAIERLSRGDRRTAQGAAVLYADLDGLGAINREHGHPAGDAVLTHVADRLAGALRADDCIARVGGDEFVVLAPRTDAEGAHVLALKLADAVTRQVGLADGKHLVPTITIGVTVGDSDADFPELVARADASMLERKREKYADRRYDV